MVNNGSEWLKNVMRACNGTDPTFINVNNNLAVCVIVILDFVNVGLVMNKWGRVVSTDCESKALCPHLYSPYVTRPWRTARYSIWFTCAVALRVKPAHRVDCTVVPTYTNELILQCYYTKRRVAKINRHVVITSIGCLSNAVTLLEHSPG